MGGFPQLTSLFHDFFIDLVYIIMKPLVSLFGLDNAKMSKNLSCFYIVTRSEIILLKGINSVDHSHSSLLKLLNQFLNL
ncbi:hypothetical protein J2Z69_003371 [Paenibacillus shirakamiensis]|uniref:Uncharacterized protein n=1 Tax=Paenibacillus shirakamiensis TaxID=1265935 RepID=A0ABS4JKQ9_9BACL|nr:hypothetical protein [Paenibacillus shirakamiensis]